MAESALIVIAERLKQSPVIDMLDSNPIAFIYLHKDLEGRNIVLNRLHETREHGNVQAVVAVTCYSRYVERLEDLADAVIDVLRDSEEPWSYREAKDVQFVKVGTDVTGWDAERQKYLRSIEFAVNW